MRSAARQATEQSGPDTGADLTATLAQVRKALLRPGNSPAVARLLAGLDVTLLEIHAGLVRNTEALACDGHLADLKREAGHTGQPFRKAVPLPRARKARQAPLLRVLPG